MKRADMAKNALPTENGKAATPAGRPPDGNVVRLKVEPVRPTGERQESGQAELGLLQPVQSGDQLGQSMKRLGRTLTEQHFAQTDKPKNSFHQWVHEEGIKQKVARIEQEMRESLSTRSVQASPIAAKLRPKPKQSKAKDNRQVNLAFDAARPPAIQAKSDPETELVEVTPQPKITYRDEILAMELPLFAVSKIPEVWDKPRTYPRKNGQGFVTIATSSYGAATIHDCDLMIYCTSYIHDMLRRNQEPSRKLGIDSDDFFRKTGRGHGRSDYEGIVGMLDRLMGTTLKTNIPTHGVWQIESFGIIESYEIVLKKERLGTRKNPDTGKDEPWVFVRILKFNVTLSEWFYNSARHDKHILVVDPAYFALDSGVERRLYQIARRHCGTKKVLWKIGLDHLAKKVGTRQELRMFRRDIRNAIRDDRLPGYHIALDSQATPNWVVFYPKVDETDEKAKANFNQALSSALTELSGQGPDGFNAFTWYERLEKAGSKTIQAKPDGAQRKARKRQLAEEREAKRKAEEKFIEASGQEPDGD